MNKFYKKQLNIHNAKNNNNNINEIQEISQDNNQNNSELYNINNLTINGLLTLKIYPKVISIISNNDEYNKSNVFFINNSDSKLYRNNNNGYTYYLANGNYFIGISNNEKYVNKAWTVIDGNMNELHTYFDITNSKLIIDSQEITTNGTFIITDDYKIYIRIGNIWTSH